MNTGGVLPGLGPLQRHAYRALHDIIGDFDVTVTETAWIEAFPMVQADRRHPALAPVSVTPTRGTSMTFGFLQGDAVLLKVGLNVYRGFGEDTFEPEGLDSILDHLDATLNAVLTGGFTETLRGRTYRVSFAAPNGNIRTEETRTNRAQRRDLRRTCRGRPPPWPRRPTREADRDH